MYIKDGGNEMNHRQKKKRKKEKREKNKIKIKEEREAFSKWHGNDYFKTAGQPFPILKLNFYLISVEGMITGLCLIYIVAKHCLIFMTLLKVSLLIFILM